MKALDLKNKAPNLLLYGPAGTGKTALVSQAAGGYLFDFDDGMRTALTLKDAFTPQRQQVEFDTYVDPNPYRPTGWLGAKAKMQELLTIINPHYPTTEIKYQIINGVNVPVGTVVMPPKDPTPPPFDAVVVDGLTGMAKAIQNHVMGLSGGGVFNVPQIQHYGMFVSEANQFLTMLRSLNCLVLVTAHEMLVEDGTNVLLRIMSVTRQHGMNQLPWQFDEVLHTRLAPQGQGKFNYVVSGSPSQTVLTRTRSGLTSDIVINDKGLKGLLELVGYTYATKGAQQK